MRPDDLHQAAIEADHEMQGRGEGVEDRLNGKANGLSQISSCASEAVLKVLSL